MDEIVQIQKCLAGRNEAFEALVTKYKNLVYSIAYNALVNKNDAADATQEVFLKAWANLSKYNPEFSFKTWIAKITVNHCINLNQKNKHTTTWDDEEMEKLATDSLSPEETALIHEKQDAVRKAIEALPPMYRVIVQLYHQQFMSYEEICHITGNPMSIIKNRLYRGRKILAERLSPYSDRQLEKEGESWIAVSHGS